MNRIELQRLANEKVRDARALLESRRWSAAYYLVGYAVEFGLKSCFLRYAESNIGILFEDPRLSQRCFTHNVQELLKLSRLSEIHQENLNKNPDLNTNWALVLKWEVEARYKKKSKREAVGLFRAIAEPRNGVMTWIKMHW